MNTLNDVCKLYYPSVDKNGIPLESNHSTKIYKQVCASICKISGGLTHYPVQGLYVNSNGQMISDDISLLVAYTDKLDSLVSCMHENAMLILKELNQESVAIEINNKLEFITG